MTADYGGALQEEENQATWTEWGETGQGARQLSDECQVNKPPSHSSIQMKCASAAAGLISTLACLSCHWKQIYLSL